MQSVIDRLAPSDIEAEMCAIASLLIHPDRAEQVKLRQSLREDWFFSTDNQILFRAVAKMIDSGKPLDPVTTSAALVDGGVLEEIGGVEYMAQVYDKVPSAWNGSAYAARVKDMAIRRAAITMGMKLSSAMYNGLDADEVQEKISAVISQLWKLNQAGSALKIFTLEEILHEFMASKEAKKSPSLLTGIDSLDYYSGIFTFGGYTIIAGRPSMGKSTLARWLLGEWARAGTRVGLIAVEENRQKIAGNYISAETGIENHIVAYRDWGKPEWEAATNAVANMAARPWFGVDTAFKLDEVTAAFEMLVTEKKCRVVALDHLHLVQMDRTTESEQRDIKEISARFKELAKRFNVVGIALAQLHRPIDKSKVPAPPTLTDLRASGAIEEHCDSAMFIHREDYYRRGEQKTYDCCIGIEKNRNGRTGKCILRSELQYQRFVDTQQIGAPNE